MIRYYQLCYIYASLVVSSRSSMTPIQSTIQCLPNTRLYIYSHRTGIKNILSVAEYPHVRLTSYKFLLPIVSHRHLHLFPYHRLTYCSSTRPSMSIGQSSTFSHLANIPRLTCAHVSRLLRPCHLTTDISRSVGYKTFQEVATLTSHGRTGVRHRPRWFLNAIRLIALLFSRYSPI